MPELTDYPVLLTQFEKPLKQAQAIGWGDDTKTEPTRQHVTALVMELEITRRQLAQAMRVVAIMSAVAVPPQEEAPVKEPRPC